MLFLSFFKSLQNQVITVELKNDLKIQGTLQSVDQYLNIKLDNITVLEQDKYPHLSCIKNAFIRGSVVRFIHLKKNQVDLPLIQDATRKQQESVAAASSK